MTKTITSQIVKRLAVLSRLSLTEQEISSSTGQLEDILQHFSSIQAIDTKGVSTYDNATGLTNVTRTDEPKPESLCACDDLVGGAPESQDGHIKVHAVFE